MILKGRLIALSPIYRGNARKTLFTRDGDGKHRMVSLAGEIGGTAQALMDAFIGQSKNGKNIGLINQLWQRLYGNPMPSNLISRVECKLNKDYYPRNNFFDLRMGIKLDEDRWAAESNANYKMETVLKNSVFDMTLTVDDKALKNGDNAGKLYHVLDEIRAGRFWFGAGKSKGLGRVRLEMDLPFEASKTEPDINPRANHLSIDVRFDAVNPVLAGWNWGKVDPQVSAFPSIEARLLISAMRQIPEEIRERLEMALGGAILDPDDWKKKFADYLPRMIAIRLGEAASGEVESWVLPEAGLKKLGKGKHGLNKKLLKGLEPLTAKKFTDEGEAEAAVKEALGKKANMAKRVMGVLEHRKEASSELDPQTWYDMADSLGMERDLFAELEKAVGDEVALTSALKAPCEKILTGLFDQVDQQLKMLQSDVWVDEEIKNREEHLAIKKLLKAGAISEMQWDDPDMPPKGIRKAVWREFLQAHSRVRFKFMLNKNNLDKSIVNDENHIEFLKSYRDQTRQELSQPHHIDYRAGGIGNREISQKYGKPYDNIFMRMLTWVPSAKEQGNWEAYIPGSTVKGAFRKRASQLLKTLWGDGRETQAVLDTLFGRQGLRGMILFSDAYLSHPEKADEAWCSMDGVRMDPATGQPIETAKHDYLYAYGKALTFSIRMDLMDISEKDLKALAVFQHLLQDFRVGDIPLGGNKTSGFGWVNGLISKMEWSAGDPGGLTAKLFSGKKPERKGAWHVLALEGEEAAEALAPSGLSGDAASADRPPEARGGFISHRSFGGYCGRLVAEAEVLTPLHIRESGEPSFTTNIEEGPVNGWDFFSMAPPSAQARPENRTYAIPSRSLKGMIRHIYSIACDARKAGTDISRLNPAENLFGWVGDGPNQAIMGRVTFDFAKFESPELAWFEVPYPYGDWRFQGGEWKQISGASAEMFRIENTWRLFAHAPLAPVASTAEGFAPKIAQASWFRAVLPGAKARFSIRFWNLQEDELQRLLWSVQLEDGLAHKIGKNRYLGFGSLRLSILPESYLIDWKARYAGKGGDGRTPLDLKQFDNTNVIRHRKQLLQGLNAEHI